MGIVTDDDLRDRVPQIKIESNGTRAGTKVMCGNVEIDNCVRAAWELNTTDGFSEITLDLFLGGIVAEGPLTELNLEAFRKIGAPELPQVICINGIDYHRGFRQ
jgi:hypothetical protein